MTKDSDERKTFEPKSAAIYRETTANGRSYVNDFDFGAQTAEVFDDMLTRSVPYYLELQRMIGEITKDFALPNTYVYDLGCSTGNTLVNLSKILPKTVSLIGIDSSPEMLKRAQAALDLEGAEGVKLSLGDLNHSLSFETSSVVILNLTLQFVRPLRRSTLVKSIAENLHPEGCLILIEKMLPTNSTINRLFIDYYYDFKRRMGYSELEIAEKREALENVLVPYRFEENRELLLGNGFRSCEVFFQWYNFCGLIAVK